MVLSVCVDLKHTVNLFTKHHAGQLMRKSHGGKTINAVVRPVSHEVKDRMNCRYRTPDCSPPVWKAPAPWMQDALTTAPFLQYKGQSSAHFPQRQESVFLPPPARLPSAPQTVYPAGGSREAPQSENGRMRKAASHIQRRRPSSIFLKLTDTNQADGHHLRKPSPFRHHCSGEPRPADNQDFPSFPPW